MNVTIEKAENLEELSLFLAEMNNNKKSHIGYCGENPEEIYQTLKEDFVVSTSGETSFMIARNNVGEIIAAIGLDMDDTEAEVWGPFNQTSSVKLQHQLWERVAAEYPIIDTYYFFINRENRQQQQFLNEIKAKETGEHLILEIKEPDVERVSELKSVPFTESDFHAFEKLHNETFPDTYYDARTITKRLGNGNRLRLMKAESGELQGYAYFEIDTVMSEASLEYVGISAKAQNQGLGTRMLKEALTEMFSYPQIKEVILTIEHTNNHANHVYMKAGFKPKHHLFSYVLEL